MNAVGGFFHARIGDLKDAQVLMLDGWQTRSLPSSHVLTLGRILTPLALLVFLNVMLALATSNGRRRFLEVAEAVLASILMAALLVAVLGMPIGAIYLVLKAAAYFIRAVLSLPIISGIFVSIRDRIIT
ncbi:hypothetical protein WJX77_008818 [Trebouxia sp. C0004]